MDVKKLLAEEIDFKSKVLILCQRNRWELNFRVINDTQTQNNHSYEIEVVINNYSYGSGIANSKKEAEQNASKLALQKIETL